MPYSLELLLPEEPILIGTIHESFSLKDDLGPYLNELASILATLDQPVYYIHNALDFKVNVFQDFLVAANKTFREEAAIFTHPYFKPVIVSTDPLMKLAIKGINSEIFGNLNFPVFETVEEALAHIRTIVEK